tara:strand:+ start:493 stop:804 length:312 start_codon:yes stop_codon:yes gene_type:complete
MSTAALVRAANATDIAAVAVLFDQYRCFFISSHPIKKPRWLLSARVLTALNPLFWLPKIPPANCLVSASCIPPSVRSPQQKSLFCTIYLLLQTGGAVEREKRC